MSQTQKIGALIVFGYIAYTTARGNLGEWLEILGLK